jgi:rSAM/selenodomain-associated transferase 2
MINLSVVIPTYNEEGNIGKLLLQLLCSPSKEKIEILVIDGGSSDKTAEIVQQQDVQFYVSPEKGRAAQLSYGATLAKGEVLYFLHADSIPQKDYFEFIMEALRNGNDAGCFSYIFDDNSGLKKINSYLTKFNTIWTGGGDQSLFITKVCYQAVGGYNMQRIIMEDFELVKKIKKARFVFQIIDKPIIVSARKYEKNSWLRIQLVNLFIVLAWRFGASQQWLMKRYKKMLHW